MNAKLSIASELIQHKVNEHFHQGSGEIQKPIGIAFINSEMSLLPCPEGEANPYQMLQAIKICNTIMPSEVSGMACEVFVQSRESLDGYNYGDLNESNSESAIILSLQERHTKERYFALGKLDKKDNSITEWVETSGGEFGGMITDMDLY